MTTTSNDSSVLDNGVIEHPEKIGIGIWDKDALGTALNDVDGAKFGWYYDWNNIPLWDSDTTPETTTFVPMVWDGAGVTNLSKLPPGVTTLLGFNEPNHPDQANMSVAEALALWPDLMATGLRLGSPAPTMDQALGQNSWLGQFMSQADAKGYEVDFIDLHYYPTTSDVGAFKAYLEAVHEQYGRPIWVTEWALADWSNPARFTAEEQATFAREAIQMMDDLPFVERHAWFAGYSGGDGWDLNSECFGPNGELTPVGQAMVDCIKGLSNTVPPPSSNTLNGTSAGDVLTGSAGVDVISGFSGNDRMDGKEGADTLIGGAGKDLFVFSTALGATNVDAIKDFNVPDDTIYLDHKIFGALFSGKLSGKAFTIGSHAADRNDHIIYDSAHGSLLYDPDGSGHLAAVEFATLSPGLKLTASDFFVI